MSKGAGFAGFAPLQSNTTYCPNQFFDVVLPHFSRGVVRLVGYILYRTLAWSDRDGRPMHEQHQVSYRELIERAGISRGALRQAIQEAIRANLLRCVRLGQAAGAGTPAQSSVFELKWQDAQYTTDPAKFGGFFEGAGHRTYIPNQFFTRLLPHEPLCVLKVVGSIIRFSIGFEVKRGFRRQQVALSYSAIQRYSRIGSRQDLACAVRHALASNFIEQVEAGRFDPIAGRTSRAATYALRWASGAESAKLSGSKSVPATNQAFLISGSKSVPAERFNNRTGSDPRSVPEERSKNRTGREIKPENKPCKQQLPAAAIAEREHPASRRRLTEVGFDDATAGQLASSQPFERIQRQIAWMDQRHPTRNALGMLRKAIEEDWPEPASVAIESSSQGSLVMAFARHFYAKEGNNALHPVALPSSTDLAAGAPLLQALLAIWPDTSQVEGWGRQFARHAAERQRPNQPPMSLSLAARLFGDAFVEGLRRDRERQVRQTATTQREAEQARLKADYLRYLQTAEDRLREQDPARYQAFLAQREDRRRGLLRFARNGVPSVLLRGFETQGARLEDFRAFFSGEVVDFASWSARHDHEGVAT